MAMILSVFTVFYYLTVIFNLHQCELTRRENPIKELIEENFAKYDQDKSIGQLSRVKVNFGQDLTEYPVVTKRDEIRITSYTQINGHRENHVHHKVMEDNYFRFGRLLEKPELCPNLTRTILIMKQQKYTNVTSEIETIYVKPDGCEEGAIIKRIHIKTNDSSALPIYVHGELFEFLYKLNELETNQIYVSIYQPNAEQPIGDYRINEINLAFRPSYIHSFDECKTLADIDYYAKFGLYLHGLTTIFQEAHFVDCCVDPKQFVHIKQIDQPNITYVYSESDQITIQTVSIINGTEVASGPISVIPTTFGLGHQFDVTGKCQTDRRLCRDLLSDTVRVKRANGVFVLPDDCEHGAYYMETNLNTNRNNLTSDVPIYLQTNSIVNPIYWKQILNSDYLIVTIERNDLNNSLKIPSIKRYFVHEIDVFFRFDPTQVNDLNSVSMRTMGNWFEKNGFDIFWT